MTSLVVVVLVMTKLMILRFPPDNVTFNDCSLEFGQ